MQAVSINPGKMKPETTPTVAIVVALLGFCASTVSAYITSSSTAKSTAQITAESTSNAAIARQEQRASGGTIDPNGRILNRIGRPYTVAKEAAARYKIIFDQPFDRDPVVLVSAHQERLPTSARVEFSDQRSVVVSTHRNDTHAPEPGVFSFMVLESIESRKAP